jgi:hypothetical protein
LLDLPVCAGVCHSSPIDADVIIITEFEKFLPCELRAVVCDDGVRDSKAMDDVKEQFYGLLGFDLRNQPSLYPLCEFVHDDK